jgi:non-canonical purine NTP pyrophosphatase (RdgB/HAM1 family)
MSKVTFITGNQGKADFMAKFLDYPVDHQKIDLDETQSLNLQEIAEHKVRQAYNIAKRPVIIEDMGLSFNAMGRLPGPFIKWFLEEIGTEGLCKLLDTYEDRSAKARICFAYYDGSQMQFFEGEVNGRIANTPKGDNGYGWDPVFIPNGIDKTYAQMNDEEKSAWSLRTTTVFPKIKEFLQTLDKN